MRRALAAAVALLAAIPLAGCTRPSAVGSVERASTAALSGTITVDAAASLSTVFPKLGRAFEAAHPGVDVRFDFGGSSDLAAAIVAGAPIDVFAAASAATMKTVTEAKLAAAAPVPIAQNKLEIVVPSDNPGRVTGIQDFGDAKRTIVICAPTVPCGAAAQQVFALAHVTAKPDSLEQSVTGVLTKVRLGEADAGLVYITDVRAAGSAVIGIPFREADEAITDVLIAPLRHASKPALAKAFTDYVREHGHGELDAAGFLAPKR